MTATPLAPAPSVPALSPPALSPPAPSAPAQRAPAPRSTACRPAVVVVAVDGALDRGTVPRVRAQLQDAVAARPGRLVVDLAACPFVDACALTMLLDIHRQCWRAGGALTLRGCTPRVLRLLSLTGLRRVFDLAD